MARDDAVTCETRPMTCGHRTNSPTPVHCESCAHPNGGVLCRYCGIRMSHPHDQQIGAHLECLCHHHYDLRSHT